MRNYVHEAIDIAKGKKIKVEVRHVKVLVEVLEKLLIKGGVVKVVLVGVLLLSGCEVLPALVDEIDMSIIAQIESSGNPLAYNQVSRASGMYQITPVCLADYNNYHKGNTYSLEDMFVPSKGYSVANWYMNVRIPQMLEYYRHKDTVANRLCAYNAGISNVGKVLCRETRDYIRKYGGIYA